MVQWSKSGVAISCIESLNIRCAHKIKNYVGERKGIEMNTPQYLRPASSNSIIIIMNVVSSTTYNSYLSYRISPNL